MTLAVGVRVGPYEVLGPIGAGGMGEVWRARDDRLGREVALKLLPAELASDPDRLRRFEQEARATPARVMEQRREEPRPYPGLASFTEGDAERFFGREEEVAALWRKVPKRSILALIGPSGAGKTSFVRAGLVAHAPPRWRCLVATPGQSPFVGLARALAAHFAGGVEVMQQLIEFHRSEVGPALVARWAEGCEGALVVVDQAEELFTQSGEEVQGRFAELLGRLAELPGVHVLLSLRDDFLFRCSAFPQLQGAFESLTPLRPSEGEALRRALQEPAKRLGFAFEDEALVDEMLAAVEGERGALPLLAFAVSRLWEERDRDRKLLTRDAYASIGGVAGALAQHAESTLEKLGEGSVPLVRELFRNLATGEQTRCVLEWEELLSVFPTDQLRQAARLWGERGRPCDLLWSGNAVTEYSLWRERYPGGLSAVEEAFGGAMVEVAVRRRRRRRIAVAAAIAVLAVGLVVVGSFWRRSVQETRRAEAEVAQREAAQLLARGRLKLAGSPNAALAFAMASLERADNDPARSFAVEALWQGPPALFLSDPVAPMYAAWSPDGRWPLSAERGAGEVLRSRPDALIGVWDVDRAGRFALVSERLAGRVLVVPLDGSPARSHAAMRAPGTQLWCNARLSPDGTLAALDAVSVGHPEANGMRILDLSTGAERILDTRPAGADRCEEAGSAAEGYAIPVWLPDGRLVSDGDAGLRLWDLATGSSRLLRACRKAPGNGFLLLATPDSRTILRLEAGMATGETSSLEAFDIASGETREITSHGNRLSSFARDPRGTALVTGSQDGVVRVGPLDGGEPHLLFGHTGPVWMAAVSPDGSTVAAIAEDGTIRLWPMPDLSKPPLHTLPHAELLAKLRSLTNLRAVPDPASDTGWKVEIGPFPGWANALEWQP